MFPLARFFSTLKPSEDVSCIRIVSYNAHTAIPLRRVDHNEDDQSIYQIFRYSHFPRSTYPPFPYNVPADASPRSRLTKRSTTLGSTPSPHGPHKKPSWYQKQVAPSRRLAKVVWASSRSASSSARRPVIISKSLGHCASCTYTLILRATCANPVSFAAASVALCMASFRSSMLFRDTSSGDGGSLSFCKSTFRASSKL